MASLRPVQLIIAALLILALLGWWLMSSPATEELVLQAREAIDRHDEQRAVSLTKQILDRDANHPGGLLLSAIVAAEHEEFDKAIAYCQRVSSDAAGVFSDARIMAGNISLERLGKVSQAEAFFREVLADDPEHLIANERLVFVLSLQTRSWDLIPYQIRVLRQSSKAATQVQLLMRGELAYPDADYVQQLRLSDPDCAGLALAQAHIEFLAKEFEDAKRSCRRAIALQSDFPEAHAELGRILLRVGTDEELRAWQAALPLSSWKHPKVLNTAGQLALRLNADAQAARCFWESLKEDPNSVSTNYHLGQTLIRLDRIPEAQVFLQRSMALEHYERQLDASGFAAGSANSDSPNPHGDFLQHALAAKEAAESLGLLWEAYAWTLIAAQAPVPPDWAETSIETLRLKIAKMPLERTDPAFNPALTIELSGLPHLLNSELQSSALSPQATDNVDSVGRVSFSDDALAAGLSFQYDNGMPVPRVAQLRPYDFTGGGVAVIDVNMDGRSDVFFTQGSRTLPGATAEPNTASTDRVFLNRLGQKFSDVSDSAIPHGVDYSQGASVGDFNGDGFADLLIANVGQNRLLRNNGDGTFSDATSAMNGAGDDWTTSCLICDLNQDGFPDLYFVNYLAGDVLTRICSDNERRYGRCSPRDFPAAQDQVLLNEGNDLFRDVTATAGIVIPDGKGLGIVAADLNSDRKMDLFIANDGVPNFYFENITQTDDSEPRFIESAMLRGVGVNADGQSEACMGIVAEDLDRDGRLDLFVTNFLDETNTLYRSLGDSWMFEDATQRFDLAIPSLRMLGFGTQAIDADLDGLSDIVVTNGHVDSYPDKKTPYRMPPQFFHNINGLRFQEAKAVTLGSYFEGKYLGRSMARLDWNQDGAEDLVIAHLDEPVALLTNTTSERGHFLALRLVAISGARDASGCVVTVETQGEISVRQLTMGDGYQASNERRMVFGLGSSATVDRITVAWTSGQIDRIQNVAADTDGYFVEGRSSLWSFAP